MKKNKLNPNDKRKGNLYEAVYFAKPAQIDLCFFPCIGITYRADLAVIEFEERAPRKFIFDYANSTIMRDIGPTDFIARLWRREKIVLLTLDGAPAEPAIDRKMLDILDRHSAKSIWFFNCKHFDQTGEKGLRAIEVAKEIANRGHLIGNHGCNHKNLKTESRKSCTARS